MIDLREVLRDLGRSIKKGEPIVLSSLETNPPEPNSTARVDLAAIRDIYNHSVESRPQIFSGVSDDKVMK